VVPVPEPSGLVTAFGVVWVQSGGNDLWKVSRFGKVQARIDDVIRPSDGPSFPTLAAGFGSIWTIRNSQVLRIDPGSNDVVGRVTLPGRGRALAVASDGVWVLCCSGAVKLEHITADTGSIDRSERLGTSSAGFSAGPGVLWWINLSEAASVSRIDTASWQERNIPTPFYVQQVVVTPIWAWLIDDDQIGRIAVGGSKAMRTELPIPRQVLSATYADGTVWLYSGNLTGIDAETGAIVAHVHANGFEPYDSIAGVGVLAARIWTADPFRDRLVGIRRP
jgi:outer membrane protein assembly factor BamB